MESLKLMMLALTLLQLRTISNRWRLKLVRGGRSHNWRGLARCLLLLGLAALTACRADDAPLAGPASVQVAEGAYFRLPVAGRSVSSAYLTLHNGSGQAQVLTGFSSPQVRAIEMHQTVSVEGMMRMRRVPSYELLPGQTLRMQPGGYHLMLFGLPEPLAPSDKITIELLLDSGDNVSATLVARAVR